MNPNNSLSSFNLEITVDDNIAVLTPEGDCGQEEITQLVSAINKQMETGINRFILDGACVKSVHSVGLGQLIRCFSEVSRKDGRLVLSQVSSEFLQILSLTRLSKFFTMYADNEEAQAALR
jgi:anti-anti-sigma factor